VGIVAVEAVPPAAACPEVWLLFAAAEPLDEDFESPLVGVPVDKVEPVGEAVVDALLTLLFWVVSDDDELLPATEESWVPWVVEEFAAEEGARVVTALAAEVFLPEVEPAAAAVVVFAAPWT
jgi:hypothetical protein